MSHFMVRGGGAAAGPAPSAAPPAAGGAAVGTAAWAGLSVSGSAAHSTLAGMGSGVVSGGLGDADAGAGAGGSGAGGLGRNGGGYSRDRSHRGGSGEGLGSGGGSGIGAFLRSRRAAPARRQTLPVLQQQQQQQQQQQGLEHGCAEIPVGGGASAEDMLVGSCAGGVARAAHSLGPAPGQHSMGVGSGTPFASSTWRSNVASAGGSGDPHAAAAAAAGGAGEVVHNQIERIGGGNGAGSGVHMGGASWGGSHSGVQGTHSSSMQGEAVAQRSPQVNEAQQQQQQQQRRPAPLGVQLSEWDPNAPAAAAAAAETSAGSGSGVGGPLGVHAGLLQPVLDAGIGAEGGLRGSGGRALPQGGTKRPGLEARAARLGLMGALPPRAWMGGCLFGEQQKGLQRRRQAQAGGGGGGAGAGGCMRLFRQLAHTHTHMRARTHILCIGNFVVFVMICIGQGGRGWGSGLHLGGLQKGV